VLNTIIDKIKLLDKKRNLELPVFITNKDTPDLLVEADIVGKNLDDITDIKTIRLLSSDIAVFNDYAFRYYFFQFIEKYIQNRESVFIDMFMYAFFEDRENRFFHFKKEEFEIIKLFLEYALFEIEQMHKRNSLDGLTEQDFEYAEGHICDFMDFEEEIKIALEKF